MAREPGAGFVKGQRELVGAAREPPVDPAAPLGPLEGDEPAGLDESEAGQDEEKKPPGAAERQAASGGMRSTWPG